MTIVGRLTSNARVNTLKDERKVVNFTIAVNDHYTVKSKGEKVKMTAYFNCAYWLGEGMASYLKKGTLVQVEGRVFASAFVGTDGTAKASLNCHVNDIKLFAHAKDVTILGQAEDKKQSGADPADDIPF